MSWAVILSRLPARRSVPSRMDGHVELCPHRAQVLVATFEGKRGAAARHPKAGNLRQRVQDLLGDAIGEELVVRIVTEAREGEHRDRLLVGGWAGERGGQQRLDVSSRLRAGAGLLVKATLDHPLKGSGQVPADGTGRKGYIAQDGRRQPGRAVGAEGPASGCHLVQDNAERENVRPVVHRLALDLLG